MKLQPSTNPEVARLTESLRDWKQMTRSEILLTMGKIQTLITSQKTIAQIGAIDRRIEGRIIRRTIPKTRWEISEMNAADQGAP